MHVFLDVLRSVQTSCCADATVRIHVSVHLQSVQLFLLLSVLPLIRLCCCLQETTLLATLAKGGIYTYAACGISFTMADAMDMGYGLAGVCRQSEPLGETSCFDGLDNDWWVTAFCCTPVWLGVN